MLHLAHDAIAFDDIADPHFFAQHDQHTGHEILEDILKGETDRHCPDAEAGEQAGRCQAGHDHDGGDHDADYPDHQPDKRIDQVLEAGANVGLADQQIGNPCREARHDPGD